MKRIIAILTIFTLSWGVLSAQSSPDGSDSTTLYFSLSKAQQYAIEHSITMKNSSLSERQAEASRWAAIASMLPQVSLGYDYSDMLGYQMNMAGMKIAMPPSGTFGVTAAVALSGAQVVNALMGTVTMKMSDLQTKLNEQQIMEQVKLLYFSALISDQILNLLKENYVTLEKLYQFSMKSVEVGITEKVDADQILVQLATMQNTISSTARSLEMVYNSLRLAMNISFDKEIVLTQTLDEIFDVEGTLKLLNETLIPENNISYQLALQNTELTKQQKNLAGWAWGPTMSFAYQYSSKHYFSNEMTMNMTPPNMIAIKLSLPIFSSGKNLETFRKANLEYKKSLNTLDETERSLYIQHRQLRYNLTSAYEKLETQKKNIEVSQSVFDNISKKYEFGRASSLDVTNSTSSLIMAQSSYIQAALEFVNAQIELEKLLNRNIYEK